MSNDFLNSIKNNVGNENQNYLNNDIKFKNDNLTRRSSLYDSDNSQRKRKRNLSAQTINFSKLQFLYDYMDKENAIEDEHLTTELFKSIKIDELIGS